MKTITLAFLLSGRKIKIKVNTNQKIVDTLKILLEAGMFISLKLEEVNYIYSERNERPISIHLNYEQGNIYNGDVLSLWNDNQPSVMKGAL